MKRLIGPQSGKLALYCSDASISRYLRGRNWNVNKAVKMLKATLKWRMEYKPEEIRWVMSTYPNTLTGMLFFQSSFFCSRPFQVFDGLCIVSIRFGSSYMFF